MLAALQRTGLTVKRQSGSHRTLSRDGWPDFVFAFNDNDEIGPRMLARIAKRTVLANKPFERAGVAGRSMPSRQSASESQREVDHD